MFASMGVETAVAPDPCAGLNTLYQQQLKKSTNKKLTAKQRQTAATLAEQLSAAYNSCVSTGVAGPAPVPIAGGSVGPYLEPLDASGMPISVSSEASGSLFNWKTIGLLAALGAGAYFLLRKKKA